MIVWPFRVKVAGLSWQLRATINRKGKRNVFSRGTGTITKTKQREIDGVRFYFFSSHFIFYFRKRNGSFSSSTSAHSRQRPSTESLGVIRSPVSTFTRYKSTVRVIERKNKYSYKIDHQTGTYIERITKKGKKGKKGNEKEQRKELETVPMILWCRFSTIVLWRSPKY